MLCKNGLKKRLKVMNNSTEESPVADPLKQTRMTGSTPAWVEMMSSLPEVAMTLMVQTVAPIVHLS